jgi:hypothetical protein
MDGWMYGWMDGWMNGWMELLCVVNQSTIHFGLLELSPAASITQQTSYRSTAIPTTERTALNHE